MTKIIKNDDSKLGLWLRQARGIGLYSYFRLISISSRWQITGIENMEKAKATGRPILWSAWHGQILPLLSYGQSFEDLSRFTVVAVGDKRYDILSTMMQWLRVKTVPVDMSGNPMSSGRSVLKIIKEMRHGRYSMIAPDGPDGPAFTPKDGVSYIARKARAVVLPVGAWTTQAYQLRRWDRYLLPAPFAKLHIVFGEPILAEPKMDKDILLAQIAAALTKARSQAQIIAGDTPWP